MRERSHLADGRNHENAHEDAAVIGRRTLVNQGMQHGAYAQPNATPLFEDHDAAWEDIGFPQEHAEDDASDDRQLATAAQAPTQAPPATAAPVLPPPDVLNAKQKIYGDQHTKAHDKYFETHKKGAEKHRVKHGKYNRAGIHSDKGSTQVAARPGVVITVKGHKDGTFMLKGDATRYLFVKRDGKNIAQPFDRIEKAKLYDHNYRAVEKTKDVKGQRVLLNPSEPRELWINNQPVTCVLTWIDGQTAAWIPVTAIEGNTNQILNAVKARAKRWNPGQVSKDPQKIAKASKQYVFRNDRVGQAITPHGDDGDVLRPGAKGGDNVSHYLGKDMKKEGFDAPTQTDQGFTEKQLGSRVTRSVVPICMNLPSGHVPPVALDTAQAGESFFVMRAKQFHQETPVFESKQRKTRVLMKWVFGHVGMVENGKVVPDPARRGWVPLRTLADAKTVTVSEK